MREIVDNKMDYQTENELLQAECERLKSELAQAVADKKNALACLTKECQDDDMMDCLASENEILKAELAQAKQTIEKLDRSECPHCRLTEDRLAQAKACLNDMDIIGEYTGKNGERDWWSGGAWLRPGRVVAVISKA